MGRGRAKAKQTKVARALKYGTVHSDFGALEAELSQAPGDHTPAPADIEDSDEDEDPYARYADDSDEDDQDQPARRAR